MNPKLLLVLTGKTTAGKDTVMHRLLAKYPDFKRVVTTTSRKIRPGEQNGIDYNFISEDDFKQKIKNNDFLEYVNYAGNLYGTEKSQLGTEFDLIWRIDPSRAGQIKDLIKDKRLLVIYLTVDDAVVYERLRRRGLPEADIEKRMQEDKSFWEKYKDNYDFVIENVPGKLDETVDKASRLIFPTAL